MSKRKTEIDLRFAQFPAPDPVNLGFGFSLEYSKYFQRQFSSHAIRYFNKISETLCKYDSEKQS